MCLAAKGKIVGGNKSFTPLCVCTFSTDLVIVKLTIENVIQNLFRFFFLAEVLVVGISMCLCQIHICACVSLHMLMAYIIC